jgi:hypothetical protein
MEELVQGKERKESSINWESSVNAPRRRKGGGKGFYMNL